MIRHIETNFDTFEYQSPTEFVLIATIGRRRAVVAKSKDAKIDLPSYAGNLANLEISEETRPHGILSSYFKTVPIPYVARSVPLRNPESNDYDERLSEFAFVWRGINGKKAEEEIGEMLSDFGPLLVMAIEGNSKSQVEWLLSPIVAKCNHYTILESQLRNKTTWRNNFLFALLFTYLLIFLTVILLR